MKVIVSRRARRNLKAITDYIESRGSPRAAANLAREIRAAIALLADFPASGERASAVYGPDLRRLVVAPYLVFYRVLTGRVQVIAVRDGRRRPEPIER